MTMTPDILVIEDDPIMREALTDWLRAAGYGVRTAADGSAGLAAVKFAVPAVVVTDIHMPGTNGAAIISELKRYYPQVAVIAISGLFNSGQSAPRCCALWRSFSGAPPPSFRCRQWQLPPSRRCRTIQANRRAPHDRAFRY